MGMDANITKIYNASTPPSRRPLVARGLAGLTVLAALLLGAPALGTTLGDIVRVQSAEGGALIGMGLVVGLNGTGDGADIAPAHRALTQMVTRYLDETAVPRELMGSGSVAIVSLQAQVPPNGVRSGDRIQVEVSAVGNAESLQGGQLLVAPMTTPVPGGPVMAFASGRVTLPNLEHLTSGTIETGVQMVADVVGPSLDRHGRLQLVLSHHVATWSVSSRLASLINDLLEPDGPPIARAVDPKNIFVQVPEAQRDDPAGFISQIMQTNVEPELIHSGARVTINERTGTIVFTSDVEVVPVAISHRGLTITTVTPEPEVNDLNPRVQEGNFLSLDPNRRGGTKLSDLVSAFNQLKVPAEDRIAIVRQLHRTGALHAQLSED